MADIAESAPFTDPVTAISHGKRHLLVRDYTMAVTALAQACQLLADKHGDTADELGEPYLLYGRALLGLAREEAGVLGGGVPGSEEAEEDEDEDEEEGDDEKLSNVDEKEEEDEESGEQPSNAASTDAGEGASQCKTDDSKAAEVKATKSEGEKSEEKPESSTPNEEAGTSAESNKTDDSKIAEQVAQRSKVDEKEDVTPSSSKETGHVNGPSSSTEQNGDFKENGEGSSDDVEKEDEEDEVNNLQVAWEVLELAKLVLLKRGPTGWKLLADSYRLLGEVAMESGNYQGALYDLQGCLDLLHKIEPSDPRAIAEIHYQLALAHSLGNEFVASIEQFTKAKSLLEARIKELEEMKEPPKSDDSFYTVDGEIQELKEVLPEIEEKISDMKDFKQEACKLVIEGIKSKAADGCSNGAGPSSSDCGSSSTAPKVQKPASDISHLVRKRRKPDEQDTEVASPCKKPTPEKAV